MLYLHYTKHHQVWIRCQLELHDKVHEYGVTQASGTLDEDEADTQKKTLKCLETTMSNNKSKRDVGLICSMSIELPLQLQHMGHI